MAGNQIAAIKAAPEIERGLAFNAIAGAVWVKVGAPFDNAPIWILFQNLTDAMLSFSWDGVDSFMSLGAGKSQEINIQSNRGISQSMFFPAHQQFWVKRTTAVDPTLGFAFISALYGNTGNNS